MNRTILAFGILSMSVILSNPSLAANPDHVQRLLKTNQCPNCDLSGADLKESNLFGANLVNANLKGADLSNANLGSANLSDADLSGAILTQAYFDRTNLENTIFTKANLTQAYLKNASTKGIKLEGAILRGAKLNQLNLVGVSFRNTDLTDANLNGSTLSGFEIQPGKDRSLTMLSERYDPAALGLVYCHGSDGLPEYFSLEVNRGGWKTLGADLAGAKLNNADLTGAIAFKADLTGADLTNAKLSNACLIGTNFKSAILDNADLKDANLKNAQLEGTSMKGTRNAELKGTFKTVAEALNSKARQEVRPKLGRLARSQQSYFAEKSQFATKLTDLNFFGDKVEPETDQYSYRLFSRKNPHVSMAIALPKVQGLKTFLQILSANPKAPKKRNRWSSDNSAFVRICESKEPKAILPKLPTTAPKNQAAACPDGFIQMDLKEAEES
jgi:uncharacterized protein YjbI with pentapeptide repeats